MEESERWTEEMIANIQHAERVKLLLSEDGASELHWQPIPSSDEASHERRARLVTVDETPHARGSTIEIIGPQGKSGWQDFLAELQSGDRIEASWHDESGAWWTFLFIRRAGQRLRANVGFRPSRLWNGEKIGY
jgi:hypothetical protein